MEKKYKVKVGMFLRAEREAPWNIPINKGGVVEVIDGGGDVQCLIRSGFRTPEDEIFFAKQKWEIINKYSHADFRRVKPPKPQLCAMVSRSDIERVVALFPNGIHHRSEGESDNEYCTRVLCKELGIP